MVRAAEMCCSTMQHLKCTLTFDMLSCTKREGSRQCVLNSTNSNATFTMPWVLA